MQRRSIISIAGASALAGLPFAQAQQQPGRVWRIGVLSTTTPSAGPDRLGDVFQDALRELGFEVGRNLLVERRSAEGRVDRLPGLAAELVGLKVDLIFAIAAGAVLAAQKATSTTPIVMAAVLDPIEYGFAQSLARPGGNITGVSLFGYDILGKQIELLRTMIPKLSRVAVLSNPASPVPLSVAMGVLAMLPKLGVTVVSVYARTAAEIGPAFASLKVAQVEAEAIIVGFDGLFYGQRERIAELAIKARLPSMFYLRQFVDAGGLISYGESGVDTMRLVAGFVAKILGGANPGQLPIQQPTKFELVVNARTALALDLKIPAELRLRADEVVG